MNSILEIESEVQPSDEWDYLRRSRAGEPWMVRVHTQSVAYGHGPQVVLRIEQRCYLRAGVEVRSQDWIKSRILVDPCANSEDEALAKVTAVHAAFLEQVRVRLHGGPVEAGMMAAEVF